MKSFLISFLSLLVVLSFGPASEACESFYLPDYQQSMAISQYVGPEYLSIMVVPDGNGDALGSAFLPDGSHVNGEIMVLLVDAMGAPIMNYCREMIELAGQSGNLTFCVDGNLPDSHTDATGRTYFRGPFHGGGASSGFIQVLINGMALESSPGMAISFNSPDMNGDLVVDLSDVVIFAGDFGGTYNYRSDLNYDGQINLSDVTRMAQHIGAGCP